MKNQISRTKNQTNLKVITGCVDIIEREHGCECPASELRSSSLHAER